MSAGSGIWGAEKRGLHGALVLSEMQRRLEAERHPDCVSEKGCRVRARSWWGWGAEGLSRSAGQRGSHTLGAPAESPWE